MADRKFLTNFFICEKNTDSDDASKLAPLLTYSGALIMELVRRDDGYERLILETHPTP